MASVTTLADSSVNLGNPILPQIPELIIGVDCAARTAYMEREGLTLGIEALMQPHAVTGFASLGEQFNTVHANNSFTCLGVAAAP